MVLLVMGVASQFVFWCTDFIKLLTDRSLYVLRFDNRDAGKSTQLSDFGNPAVVRMMLPEWLSLGEQLVYTLDDLMEDAVSLLRALHISAAHWVGMSMGSMICQLATIHYPQVVKSLTCMMSTTGESNLPSPKLSLQLQFLKKPKSDEREDVVSFHANFLRTVLTPEEISMNLARKPYELSFNRCGVLMSSKGARERHIAAVVRAKPRAEQLRQVRGIPSLVLHGSEDPLVPIIHGYRLAECLHQSRLVVLVGMGHYFTPKHFENVADEVMNTVVRGETSPGGR